MRLHGFGKNGLRMRKGRIVKQNDVRTWKNGASPRIARKRVKEGQMHSEMREKRRTGTSFLFGGGEKKNGGRVTWVTNQEERKKSKNGVGKRGLEARGKANSLGKKKKNHKN